MDTISDSKVPSFVQLPEELLQVIGSRLSSGELRNARLVCTPWAKALAHCMPAVTVALPRQASERIFRRPLVLCSSGVLNSAQCQDYSAVPAAPLKNSYHQVTGRRQSCCGSYEGHLAACCKPACSAQTCSRSTSRLAHSSGAEANSFLAAEETSPVQAAGIPSANAESASASRDKPSPFATEMGQAALDSLLHEHVMPAADRTSHSAAALDVATASRGQSAKATCTTIPLLPRAAAIKAAISMPPPLMGAAAASHQQQAAHTQLPPQQQMKKLTSVPANTTQMLPRTRLVSKHGTALSAAQQQLARPHHVVTTAGPVLEGWSSLPVQGLKTCSSLKQLNLKLSGAPPSPEDLLDLSTLPHLTHLSLRQVELPDADCEQSCTLQEDTSAEMACGLSSGSVPDMMDLGEQEVSQATAFSTAAAGAHTSCSKGLGQAALSGLKRRPSLGPVQLQAGCSRCSEAGCGDLSATTAALKQCHLSSAVSCPGCSATTAAGAGRLCSVPGGWADVESSKCLQAGSAAPGPMPGAEDDTAAARSKDQVLTDETTAEGTSVAGLSMPTHSISCSVITAEHVAALAQLPHLSSLELAPKHGVWDAAGRLGLVQLVSLTGLTRLSITWGSAAAAVPMSAEDATAVAQGDQLPLQQCLAGLTSLQELCISGAAVIDASVLQRLQQLRVLIAEGLQVVNSDVMAMISHHEQGMQRDTQQQAGVNHQPGGTLAGQTVAAQQQASAADANTTASVTPPVAVRRQQHAEQRWTSLPHLQYVHAVHPAADISLLLQSTRTPQLSHLGFVTRGPSDFARLLGQHGRLRTLHLAFPEEESWHPIAVVRLPTALPSLTSLTIDGKFWLPNSLIVALGVMEVPLEHLSLTCMLAPPCLQRLQHLKHLKRLALHHVPPSSGSTTALPGVREGKGANDVMLQLPAKLLPSQLQELEISNGWILH